MNLQIKDHLFIVCGATSGFGDAIARALVAEHANIIAIARRRDQLLSLQAIAPAQIDILDADVQADDTLFRLDEIIGGRQVHGLLINASGPPALTVAETTLADWDNAYQGLLRWKIAFAKALVPRLQDAKYGRVVFIESAAVKQPLENLVLSNSIRLAVIGFAKTYAQEIAKTGVTINVMAPGSHDTPAIERVYKKKSEQTGKSIEEVRAQGSAGIPVGFLGDAADFASLAVWLLSPLSRFITGQTISVDGGSVKGVFG